MSLRQINREREGKGFLNKFKRKKHFTKLGHSHVYEEPKKKHKNLLPIIIIIIIVVGVIGVELYLWSTKETKPAKPEPIVENITNQIPLVINETPEVVDLDLQTLQFSTDKLSLGETLIITASIKNKGDFNITNLTIAFLVGDDEIARQLVDIAAGEVLEISTNWTPEEKYVGKQNVRASVDPDEELEEEIETNNEKGHSIDVKEKLIEDISSQFVKKATLDFVNGWYSDKFTIPPESGEDYTYFQISRDTTNTYFLDIVVSGFRTTGQNNIQQVEIPDASISGWNGRMCIKETLESEMCIWNGPRISIKLDFDGSKLVATDPTGKRDHATTSDNRIDEIRMAGMRFANWPGELRTYRVSGAPQLDKLIPNEFYEVVGDTIYVFPMRWNPTSLEAKVVTWIRFEITTD